MLMVFTAIIVMHMLVFRTTGSQEGGDENRISKNGIKLIIFTDIQSSEKVDFDSLCQRFHCFYGEREFHRYFP